MVSYEAVRKREAKYLMSWSQGRIKYRGKNAESCKAPSLQGPLSNFILGNAK